MRATVQILVSTYWYWRKGIPTIRLCFAMAKMDAELKKFEKVVNEIKSAVNAQKVESEK